MSLINQMLRDLQQQKKTGGSKKPDTPRASKLDRIPYLPLPLVLTGAGVLMLFLIWWLAGALSDMMFGFEPAGKPIESQQVAVIDPLPATEKTGVASEEQSPLTREERAAEPSAAAVVSVQPEEKNLALTPAQSLQTTEVVTMSAAKAPVVVKTESVVVKTVRPAVSASKPMPTPARTIKTIRPAEKPTVQTKRQVVAQEVPKRLHPDDLPGAILSRHSPLTNEVSEIARPSRILATTPYGMAEEAFLDGQWALEQKHVNLAVRSLQYALELYPGHLPARELLVEVLGKEGKAGEAMSLLAEGLEIAPDYAVFKKDYVRLLVDQGDYDAAAKVMLNGGMPAVEEDPDAHVLLASLYQRLGESFLAAQTYRNLLVFWPQTGAFWVGLGGALEGQGLAEEAVLCYQRALETQGLRADLSLYAKKRLSLLK